LFSCFPTAVAADYGTDGASNISAGRGTCCLALLLDMLTHDWCSLLINEIADIAADNPTRAKMSPAATCESKKIPIPATVAIRPTTAKRSIVNLLILTLA
jgi:hypothetical protein